MRRHRQSPRELAWALLKRSTLPVQMAAVLSNGDGILAWGWNSGWTHAEQMAFSRAPRSKLSGATLTVYGRRNKSGNPICSKPCTRRGCWQLATATVARIEWYDPAVGWITEEVHDE